MYRLIDYTKMRVATQFDEGLIRQLRG